MKWLKRFLIRLFEIKVDDLPDLETPSTTYLKSEEQVEEQAIEKGQIIPVSSHDLASEIGTEVIDPGPIVTPEDQEEIVLPLVELDDQPEVETKPPLMSITEQELRIGIDFGTTTTAVSLKIGDDMPVPIPIGSDGVTNYIPSVVYIQPGEDDLESRAIIAEEAESYGDQTRVIRSVKRCLGCQGGYCFEDEIRKRRSNDGPQVAEFLWCQGDGKIHLGDSEIIEPEIIASLIIKEALRRFVERVQELWHIDLSEFHVKELPLNLGCGAKSNLRQRQILNRIAAGLGFSQTNLENIIEEPILAGFTFSRFAGNPTGRILIYDFGGGTFDVAVVEVDRTVSGLRVTILSTDGEKWLGGDDIDTLIQDYFLAQIAKAEQVLVGDIKSRMEKIDQINLRNAARQAKEFLSTEYVYDNVLFSNTLGTISLRLNRAKFEELLAISGLIEESLTTTERACRLAYVYDKSCESNLIDSNSIIQYCLLDAVNMIDRVVLVGGVTKIPFVRDKIAEIFGGMIVEETIVEPISAVAVGASYPREPQHYSLSAPPYSIIIKGEDKRTNQIVQKTIFEPYEPYRYHQFWGVKARPSHMKVITLNDELSKTKAHYQKVGEDKSSTFDNIGRMIPGDWKFSITLEGAICMQRIGGRMQTLKPYPTIHPVQMAIRDSMEKRWRESFPQDNRTYEECIIDMMSEN